MAVIDFVNTPNEFYSQMKRVINYITSPKKTLPHLISGLNCDSDNAYSNFVVTKRVFDKEEGRQYIHFTQAFSPEDKLSPELAHQIGSELINSGYFEGFQVVFSTHLDRDHIHNHFVINSVNCENGKKWHKSASDLAKLKEYSDTLCLKNNLSIIANESINIHKGKYDRIKNGHYKAIREMRSWKYELVLAINECRYVSVNVDDYISRMNRLGYRVDWDYTGESDEVKYAGAVIDTCKKHSNSIEDFLENMKYYGYDVEWKYVLEVSPKNDVVEPKTKLIFDDQKSMDDYIVSLDLSNVNYEWSDDIQFLNERGLKYTPDSFEQGVRFTPSSLRFAFNINSLNEKMKLPDVVKIPKDTLEYKKLIVAIKACKQLSVNEDDFVNKLSSLGYKTKWNVEPTEKEIIKEVVKELKNKCSNIDEFEGKLKEYGYTLKRDNGNVTIFNTEKGIPNDNFEFKKYDANVILKEFKNGKLNYDALLMKFERRYKIPAEQKRQLDIYLKRLEKLVDNNYVELNNGVYKITEKGNDAAKKFSGFKFSTYDANVVFGYIEKAGGKFTLDSLREMLSEEYSDTDYLEAQLNYLSKRISLNVESGYLSFDGSYYSITETGAQEKEVVANSFRKSKARKPHIDDMKLTTSIHSLEQAFKSFKPSELKPLDTIRDELKTERKHITFESPKGIKIRNNNLYPGKQFTKKSFEETFVLNTAMKDVVDLSPSLQSKDLIRAALLLGYKLEYTEQKKRYNFEINENLKCYFTTENIELMKGIGDIKLPSEYDIFKSLLSENIMYTTQNGEKCSSAQLFPFDKYSKDGMLKSFAENLLQLDDQTRNDRFELLLSAISFLFQNQETPTKFPLSRIEGEAAKERAIEEAKGRGFNWNKKNDNDLEK